ncbi:extracellular solute-binding protein [Brachybacterium sp. YJGR34]|uniref:extracellular solute-binding protein n=1 Tax=Brachybacterium sp. YJGR34 TaxID=2059911 RepID=UPI000E0B0DBE|nr:extracellular solute-binding protein [Brachybacterium sp. YJGR34]
MTTTPATTPATTPSPAGPSPAPLTRRRFALGATALSATALGLAACGRPSARETEDLSADVGLTDSGLPVVADELTLSFGGSKSALAPEYETMELVRTWQEDSGIEITWANEPDEVWAEKKNLLLASGELPDALFNTGLTDAEVAKYGDNGTLLALEDLILEHAPTLHGILEQRPDIRSAMTTSDGHIYTLPSVEEMGLVEFPTMLFINTVWLDELGMGVPTTVEEYHEALLAFRESKGSGALPLSFIGAGAIADLIAALGGQADNPDHRIVQDGEVLFTADKDGFRDAIATLHTWYGEGLIDQEAFAQDYVTFIAKGKADPQTLGSFSFWECPEVVGPDRAEQYQIVPILPGPDGVQRACAANNQEINRGAFAITRTSQYAAATLRWADMLFDPVMSAQANWGPIGISQEMNADGMLEQIPVSGGETEQERRVKVAPGGPKIITAEDFETVVLPEPRAAERQGQIAEFYAPHRANEKYPPVMLSVEELNRISTLESDVRTLVDEKVATWIVKGGIEDEWDGYVAQLEQIGLSEVAEVYQGAYDRFTENS